jgi:hypothetical protein
LDFKNAIKAYRIEACRILLLFIHFHTSAVSHFSLLGRIAPSVNMMKTVPLSNALLTNAIQFEKAKVSQSDGGGFSD